VKKPKGTTYEETKENVYAAFDNIKAFQQGFMNLIKRIQRLPSDLTNTQKSFSDTKESLTLTSSMLQKDLEIKKLESQVFGRAVWKVVSLEAAKETYVEFKEKYDSTAEYVSEIQENPKLIFKRKVEEKEIAPVPIEVKDPSAFSKVLGVLKSAKGGFYIHVYVYI
jgi:hypothetical protein